MVSGRPLRRVFTLNTPPHAPRFASRLAQLTYYTNNCLAISTSSALLAGFAWYGLTEVPFDSNASALTQTMYLVVTTLIMGLELLTVRG